MSQEPEEDLQAGTVEIVMKRLYAAREELLRTMPKGSKEVPFVICRQKYGTKDRWELRTEWDKETPCGGCGWPVIYDARHSNEDKTHVCRNCVIRAFQAGRFRNLDAIDPMQITDRELDEDVLDVAISESIAQNKAGEHKRTPGRKPSDSARFNGSVHADDLRAPTIKTAPHLRRMARLEGLRGIGLSDLGDRGPR